jgi:hypothetical protein
MIIIISETTAFFSFLVYASFFEWTLHKYLMHTPFWQYPFRAHALVHHGLFRTGDHYFLPDAKVIRKVRFAWWNAPFIIILHTPVILWIQRELAADIFVGALSALILYYFLYEYLHYCMHIPKRPCRIVKTELRRSDCCYPNPKIVPRRWLFPFSSFAIVPRPCSRNSHRGKIYRWICWARAVSLFRFSCPCYCSRPAPCPHRESSCRPRRALKAV